MPATASSRRNSILLAAAVAVALAVWILSGLGNGLPEPGARNTEARDAAVAAARGKMRPVTLAGGAGGP